jgi:hypothetical protein
MSRIALLLAIVTVAACGPPVEQRSKSDDRTIVWHRIGSWSGKGNQQTESFASNSGVLRVRWEASDSESRSSSRRVPAFRLTARSAISGRLLQQVVDHTGSGNGVSYVQQDPHTFYMIIESSEVNWMITIEDAIAYR